MLIIAHENHIVYHRALLLQVIKRIVICRAVIVHGKHNPILAALDGQLAQELQISLRGKMCIRDRFTRILGGRLTGHLIYFLIYTLNRSPTPQIVSIY